MIPRVPYWIRALLAMPPMMIAIVLFAAVGGLDPLIRWLLPENGSKPTDGRGAGDATDA